MLDIRISISQALHLSFKHKNVRWLKLALKVTIVFFRTMFMYWNDPLIEVRRRVTEQLSERKYGIKMTEYEIIFQ